MELEHLPSMHQSPGGRLLLTIAALYTLRLIGRCFVLLDPLNEAGYLLRMTRNRDARFSMLARIGREWLLLRLFVGAKARSDETMARYHFSSLATPTKLIYFVGWGLGLVFYAALLLWLIIQS
jgi:hypothetical protein